MRSRGGSPSAWACPREERVGHPVLERIQTADFAPQRKLAELAESQLGTVGSGNHYVNLMEDEEGRIWVGVHFGSRGFGHKTASGFLALAQGLPFEGRSTDGEMDSPPVLFEVGSELGDAYVAAMELAGQYAYAGRDVVVAKVLEILGAEAVHEVHNHHNFAWREEHLGRTYWVVRKGCTPAFPGQEGFVGGSMGDESVILEGIDGEEAEESLYSTVHGAGRVMSRSRAAGRFRFRKQVVDGRKIRVQEQVKPGVVDWPAVQARLREQGIVLVGGGADEAPEVYKRLPEVLSGARRLDPREAHASTARRRDGGPRDLRPLQGLTHAAALSRLEALSRSLAAEDVEHDDLVALDARNGRLQAGCDLVRRLAPLETSSARASFAAQSVIPIDRPPGASRSASQPRKPVASRNQSTRSSRKVRSPSTMLSGGPAKVVKRATAGVSWSRVGSVSSSPMKSSYRSTLSSSAPAAATMLSPDLPSAPLAPLERLQGIPEAHDASVAPFGVAENEQAAVAVELPQPGEHGLRRHPGGGAHVGPAAADGREARVHGRKTMRGPRRAGRGARRAGPGCARTRARLAPAAAPLAPRGPRGLQTRQALRTECQHTTPAVFPRRLLDEPGAHERRGLAGERRPVHRQAGREVADRRGPFRLQAGEDRVLGRSQAVGSERLVVHACDRPRRHAQRRADAGGFGPARACSPR